MDTDVCKRLIEMLGIRNVELEKHTLRQYSHDGLRSVRAYPRMPKEGFHPDIIVLPKSVDEVVMIIKLAAEKKIPIIPRGTGTGLMGGAVASKGGIVIDMRRMNRILSIDINDRTALVESGVVLGTLELELNKNGLILGHDPWTLSFATVGGSISTNGLGYRGAKYGSMGDQVLGLEVVLPNGEVLRSRAVQKSSTGFNINYLFVGSEGTMGIISKATLRVFPMPEKRLMRVFEFSSFDDGFRACDGMFRIGLKPALLDYGGADSPSLKDKIICSIFGSGGAPTMYLGFEGFEEEVDAQEKRAKIVCKEYGGREISVKEAEKFWDDRHELANRVLKSPSISLISELPIDISKNIKFDYIHVSLPASKVLQYHTKCLTILAKHNTHMLECGIWTQPELFSMMMLSIAASGRKALENLEKTVDEVLTLAQDLGGSIEYCHGIGLRLAHLMEREHGNSLHVIRKLKTIIDPYSIMNPGKLAL